MSLLVLGMSVLPIGFWFLGCCFDRLLSDEGEAGLESSGVFARLLPMFGVVLMFNNLFHSSLVESLLEIGAGERENVLRDFSFRYILPVGLWMSGIAIAVGVMFHLLQFVVVLMAGAHSGVLRILRFPMFLFVIWITYDLFNEGLVRIMGSF